MGVRAGAIDIESMVSRSNREPFVVLRWGSEEGQLTPTEARAHARKVLEAAEAADQDAFLVHYLESQVQVGWAATLATLAEFRAWRAARDPEVEAPAEAPEVRRDLAVELGYAPADQPPVDPQREDR